MSPSIDGLKRRALGTAARAKGVVETAILDGETPWKQPHPAAFKPWVRRNAGRPSGDYPASWRMDEALPFDQPAVLGVVVHIYYPDLVDELISALEHIPVSFDVLVTNASDTVFAEEQFRVGNAANVKIFQVDNHGRDIFPLVQLANAGVLDPYLLILKLHTKKSQWREDHSELSGSGDQWRDSFLSSLIGDRARVEQVLDAFATTPALGCMTAPGNVLGPEFWGGDEYLATELAKRLELEIDARELQFAAGSMYWIRGFVLQGLRALMLTEDDFDTESGQVDATTAHALERLIGILTQEAGLQIQDTSELPVDANISKSWQFYEVDYPRTPAARYIPFYLPQFHPSEENDRWWGKGFTEWTNVTAAKPAFRGHRQPLLPGELGFYDLRLAEVRESQYLLSSTAGIEGFMYYYYWFAGKRLLNVPIESLHEETDLPQPFCIMWANENWTRTWDGRTRDVLIGQDYDETPAKNFIDDVAEFLLDPRYIRVDGKALLAVYRPAQIPDFAEVVLQWRDRARELDIGELLILAVDVAKDFDGVGDNPQEFNLDGSLGFPPHALPWKPAPAHRLALDKRFKGNMVSYAQTAKAGIQAAFSKGQSFYPGVMVGFDNTARRQWRPDIWWGSNPYTFHRWLRQATRAVAAREWQQRIVFINAWNEWAESAVLEPTQRWGNTYLQAVRSVAYS